MNLKQFKSWKLLFEDNDLCFSKAVYNIDQSNVFFITFFNPENMSVATKHLIEDHLHNYVALIEEEGKLHLILKSQDGRPVKKFISKTPLEYEDRVQIVYEYFKLIEKYDAFPNAIKIQLLDEEQVLISDEGIAFRELIDYTLTQSYSTKEVFKQLGKTIDMILNDAEGYHSQFIDNLLLGHHKYETLKAAKNNFKDIFIFEKPDALESINYEYTIILNDLEAGPPIKFTPDAFETIKKQEPIQTPVFNETHMPHDELHSELAEFLSGSDFSPGSDLPTANASTIDAPQNFSDPRIVDESYEPEDIEDDIAAKAVTADETTSTDKAVSDEIREEPLVIPPSDFTSGLARLNETKSFKAIFHEDDQMPEILPKSLKQRFIDEDEDLFGDDMLQMFDEEAESLPLHKNKFKIKWFVICAISILIVILGIWGFKTLFNATPITARFEIEPLHDNRIAFMNTSTGEKQIEHYSWEIYYADTLVQTFTDENLFPVFDTEGAYKIVLKVQDKKGTWSEPFTKDYEFKFTEETTTTP